MQCVAAPVLMTGSIPSLLKNQKNSNPQYTVTLNPLLRERDAMAGNLYVNLLTISQTGKNFPRYSDRFGFTQGTVRGVYDLRIPLNSGGRNRKLT